MTCGNQGKKSYDNDPVTQCEVLKDAYPVPFTVQQLKKVRSLSRDPEMLRSYLLELAKRRYDQELTASRLRNETSAERSKRFSNGDPFFNAQYLYEKWVKPSPESRVKFIRQNRERLEAISTVKLSQIESAVGPDSTILLRKSLSPDLPNQEGRDEAISRIKSGRVNFQEEGAVGFTEIRYESSTGRGFSIRLTPRGAVLPLIRDDFE